MWSMARLQRTAPSVVLAIAWMVCVGCSGDGGPASEQPVKTPSPASEDTVASTGSDEVLLSYAGELTKRHRLWEENRIGQWRLQEPGQGETSKTHSSPPYEGVRALEENILISDTIARVELLSVSTSVRRYTWASPTDRYVATLEFRFRVHEYLKDSGPNEITAFVTDNTNPQGTAEEARELLADIAARRPTRWDDRQAIVFMVADWEWVPDTSASDIYYMGIISAFGGDGYTIESRHRRNWLPAAAATAEAGGRRGVVSPPDPEDQEFLLEPPDEPYTVAPATIRLNDLKAKIASIEAEVTADGGLQE